MKTLSALVCSLILAGSLTAAQASASDEYTFTPPYFQPEIGGQVFQYFLPAADGFAASVNLQIQPFDGDMSDYIELSEDQFEQMNFNVLTAERSGDEILYEYTGNLHGADFHWYSRVLKVNSLFYVVTATALEERWDVERDQLIDSVHSFALPQ